MYSALIWMSKVNFFVQEYKARKRQRLQKKLQEQLQQGMAASTTRGASQDLQSLITSISERAASAGKTKGSRFTHTEKLQFAQVKFYCICVF